MPYPHRLLLVAVLVDLFVVGLAALSIQLGHRQYQERAELVTHNLAEALERNLVNAIERINVSLLALLDIHAIHHGEHVRDPALMTAHIEKIRIRLPEVEAIRMTDAQGMLIYGNDIDPEARVSLADRPHFVTLRDHPEIDLAISRPQISRVNNAPVIVLARRVTRPDGAFDGMIFAAIPLKFLARQFAELDLGPGGVVALLDDERGLITRHPPPTSAGPDDRAHTASLRKLDDYPLFVSVGLATDDYLAPWYADTLKLTTLVTLFLLASLVAARAHYRAWRRQQKSNEVIVRQEALYHELVEDTPMLVVRYQPDTTIEFANTAYADFFNATPDALKGKRWLDFIPREEDQMNALANLAALTAENPVASNTLHHLTREDGQTRWMQWSNRAFFNARGTLTHLQSIGEDITERKRTRDIQAARLRLMEFAVDHSMHELLVATLDEAGILTESPIGFYHFLAADQKTLSLQAWSTYTSRDYCKAEGSGRHYDIDAAGVWVDAVRERRPIIHNDYAALPNKRGLPPGHAELIREMVVPVFRKGLIVAILGVGNKAAHYTDDDLQAVVLLADLAWDFAESKRLEAELVAMATTDFLTGLFNRRNFMVRMEQELARLKRFDIERAAVLMLDLDHFKRVNDQYGHAAGDAVLKHFAALIHAELRKIDTGGRLGGEEFAILLLGADLVAAEQFAERLRVKVADTALTYENQTIKVTVSIGITTLMAADANTEAALSRADAALYDAKHGGRNRVCIHSSSTPL